MKGRHAGDPLTRQVLTDAEAYYQRALEIDPEFVAAQEALAVLHLAQAANGFALGDSGYPRVKGEATKLMAHNRSSVTAHALLCRYHFAYSWNWTDAQHECDLALRIDPRSHMANYQAAELALTLGRPAQAERLFRDILSVDPLDSDTRVELSGALLSQGRFTEAEAEARKALTSNPSIYFAHFALGTSLLAQARPQEALEAFQSESPDGGQQAGVAMAYHALGRNNEAAIALKRFAETNGPANAYTLAVANAYLGNTATALECLETAFREHDPALQYVKTDWLLKPLGSDAGFRAFLRKMNLPE